MRQLRVKTNSCHIQDSVKSLFSHCNNDYSFSNEEKQSFSPGWMNQTTSISNSSIDQAFVYQSGGQLDTYFFVGSQQTYDSGGYVYQFRGRLSDLQSNLSTLHQLEWIDSQTRAVIIQFSLYNPNAQLFTSVILLAEFLSTGGIITQSRFEPISFQSNFINKQKYKNRSLCFSVSICGSTGLLDYLSHVYHSSDDWRDSIIFQIENKIFSSILVID